MPETTPNRVSGVPKPRAPYRLSRGALAVKRFRRLLLVGAMIVIGVVVLVVWALSRWSNAEFAGARPAVIVAAAPADGARTPADSRPPAGARTETAARRATESPAWIPAGSYESIRERLEPLVLGGGGGAEEAMALTFLSQEVGLLTTARRALERVPGVGIDPELLAFRDILAGRQAFLENRTDDGLAIARRVARGVARQRPQARLLLAKAAEVALEKDDFQVAGELALTAGPEDGLSLHLSAVRVLAVRGQRVEAVEHLRKNAAVFPPIERTLAQAEILSYDEDKEAFRDSWDAAYDLILEQQRDPHVLRLLVQARRARDLDRLDLGIMTWAESLPGLPLDEATLVGMMLDLIRHGATRGALTVADVIAGRDHVNWSKQQNVTYLRLLVEEPTLPLAQHALDLWHARPEDPVGAATALLAAVRVGNGEAAGHVWASYPPTEWARTGPGTRAVVAWCLIQANRKDDARALVLGVMPEGLLVEEAKMLEEVWAALEG